MKKLNYFVMALLFVGMFTIKCDVVEAAVTYADPLPDTVTVGEPVYMFITGTDITNTSSISNYPELVFSQDGNYQLYCSNRNQGDLVPGTVLTKGERLDYGLAYILLNSYPMKGIVGSQKLKTFVTNSGIEDYTGDPIANFMVDVWTTQMAIWNYQGSINRDGLSDLAVLTIRSKDSSASLAFVDFSATSVWNQYVSPLVANAQNTNSNTPYNANLAINVDGEWSKIDGTNNSKSGLISVSTNSSASFATYALSISNAPSDTKVYTEAGNDITDSISSIPANTKVYLVVNRDNIKEDVKFTITASTTISYNAAYQYVDLATGHQPSILVGPETKDLSASLEMTLSPDTALSVSSSIYFLGFIILVSGAFIIYANVKPKKETAE